MVSAQYRCPICAQPLQPMDRSWGCINNHRFDQAREGYVNLLPVQHKHSKDPGDNKEMILARRAFLGSGFYAPLRQRIVDLYQHHGGSGSILDAGCGEGYYTSAHKTGNNIVYGVDIAKNAIKMAAKKYLDCHFSVASVARLPFEDSLFDWIYSVYAPIRWEEFRRLLQQQGFLLTVTPGPNHLWELKQLIYQNAQRHKIEAETVEGLALVSEENLTYPITFTEPGQSLNLLAMTPFAFKTKDLLTATLANATDFCCQADFMIRLYQKTQ